MSARTIVGALVLVVVTALVTTQVISQEGGKPEKSSGKDTGQPEMSKEEQAIMEKMMAAATPGEAHAKLAKTVGSWTYTIKWRMDEKAPWQEHTGTAVNATALDGRFIQETVKGSMGPGMEFNGFGYIGYDNVTKKYNSVWFDNCTTGIMYTEGTSTDAGKTITFTGNCSCPIEGGPKKVKSVMTTKDDNSRSYLAYSYDKSGKEFLGMEIHYTRATGK